MKLNLDEIERKARAAEQDEWQWRPANGDILEGKHAGQVVLAGEDLLCSVGDRAHIAAASPPVVIALVAIARNARAYVDEQGKRVAVDRGYTLDLPEHFASIAFEQLVAEMERHGL